VLPAKAKGRAQGADPRYLPPKSIKWLAIEPTEPTWSKTELASLRRELEQGTLFRVTSVAELQKVPYNFKYVFTCDHDGCKGHALSCIDWEMLESWRSWRGRDGEGGWEEKFRKRYERDMIQKCDTLFFAGTLKAHPGEWNVVGLFYPPKTTADLFSSN
jgi:hypothetical protein